MVRAGQSSEKAALIYQHSDLERQQEVAQGIDAWVRAKRNEVTAKPADTASGADLVQGA